MTQVKQADGTWLEISGGGGAAPVRVTYTGDGTTGRLIALSPGNTPIFVVVTGGTSSGYFGFITSPTNVYYQELRATSTSGDNVARIAGEHLLVDSGGFLNYSGTNYVCVAFFE